MQSSLCDKIIQTIRQAHLQSDVYTLLTHWDDLDREQHNTVFPLLTRHAPSDAQLLLRRDILALVLTRVVHWLSGIVKGDFVRALYSGKSWHTLCILFDNPKHLECFKLRGPIIFRELMGDRADDVHLHFPQSLSTGTCSWKGVTIRITFMIVNEENHHPLPRTWGHQLELDLHHGVRLAPAWPDTLVPLHEIVHALRNGCDIPLKLKWEGGVPTLVHGADDGYHMLVPSQEEQQGAPGTHD